MNCGIVDLEVRSPGGLWARGTGPDLGAHRPLLVDVAGSTWQRQEICCQCEGDCRCRWETMGWTVEAEEGHRVGRPLWAGAGFPEH